MKPWPEGHDLYPVASTDLVLSTPQGVTKSSGQKATLVRKSCADLMGGGFAERRGDKLPQLTLGPFDNCKPCDSAKVFPALPCDSQCSDGSHDPARPVPLQELNEAKLERLRVTARATAPTVIQTAPAKPIASAPVFRAIASSGATGAPETTKKTTTKVASRVGSIPTTCSLAPKSFTASTM